MSTANPCRGEVTLELGGESHVLRPSFGALVAAEAELGPLLDLAQEASEGRVRLESMVRLFHHCLVCETEQHRLSPEAIGERLVKDGMIEALKTYRALLEAALGGSARQS